MIEQYFIPGLEYNWKAPPQPQPQNDGDFVESGQREPPRLCYAGIGGEIPADASQMPADLTNDFTLPYVWLNYVVGRTAYVEPNASDVLTGFMSGCWICTWRWGQGGQLKRRRVGHVGTVESAPKTEPPNSTVKDKFRQAVGLDELLGYNPFIHWDLSEIEVLLRQFKQPGDVRTRILSLVAAPARPVTVPGFYSILMFTRLTKPDVWICGGKKKVDPTDYKGVLEALQ